MGNCTSCTERRRSSLPSYPIASRSLHPNPLSSRLRNFRLVQPYNLNALIDETLAIIRTVVDTDQDLPHAMLVISRIANREDRWLNVMLALVERIPINDPLGATVIALLLDECPLPSKELLQQLISLICSDNHSRVKLLQTALDKYVKENQQIVQKQTKDVNIEEIVPMINSSANEQQEKLNKKSSLPKLSVKASSPPDAQSSKKIENEFHRDRNTLILLGCLAEKLVGPTSVAMLNTNALEFVIDRVYLGLHNYEQLSSPSFDADNQLSSYSSVFKIILFALVTVEKFSQSSESKHILLQSLTVKDKQKSMNVLEYYETWTTSANCLKRQIGFYAQWLLDNVFILDYRRSSYETLDHQAINVILNDKDVSEYLKIGPDGLEARSDTVSFESVRSTFSVRSDVWYYEVLIVTDGVMQIGWATKQSKFMNNEGYGIGDDQYSIAYDGCRNLIWFGAKSIAHNNPPWKPGDILGCLIDFDRREVIFSLNGRALDPFRKVFSSSSTPIIDGFFAASISSPADTRAFIQIIQ
ncbi:unnamed protein product [Adineta ricciae]|uniref:B30.2/SPRY domain-containing protein n=1 Tax=Adineta ricciae TaxID=249248 RepID=A0A814EEK0_ADIRI|nr:unnamed protein product [Adineta ricciae]